MPTARTLYGAGFSETSRSLRVQNDINTLEKRAPLPTGLKAIASRLEAITTSNKCSFLLFS